MPELPEVETVVNSLRQDLSGLTIVDAKIKNPNLKIVLDDVLLKNIVGRVIKDTYRRAKWPALVLDNGYLWFHLGMTGQMLISNTSMSLDKHVNLIMTLSNGKYLVFKDHRRFGCIVFTDTNIPPAKNLGPEPLDPSFTGDVLYAKLKLMKQPIKKALLEGAAVAGIGNIYASEILFESKIHPERPSNKLTLDECKTICMHTKSILANAIAAGGSTLRDYRKPDGSKGTAQNIHKVYDRTGKPCVVCGDPIVEGAHGGRSTFWCNTCQPN